MRRVDIATADKQQRALELRRLGASYDRIADQLGYSNRSGAWQAVQAALKRAVIEPAREQRIIADQRLDFLLQRSLVAFADGDLDQIRNILAIEKRRADLWGLDAPKGVEVTGRDGGPIETDVGALLRRRLVEMGAVVEMEPTREIAEAIEVEAHE
jgi:hypothetical protein